MFKSHSYLNYYLYFVYAATQPQSGQKYACPRLRPRGYAGLRIFSIVRRNLVKTDGLSGPQRSAGLFALIYQALIALRALRPGDKLVRNYFIIFVCGESHLMMCPPVEAEPSRRAPVRAYLNEKNRLKAFNSHCDSCMSGTQLAFASETAS